MSDITIDESWTLTKPTPEATQELERFFRSSRVDRLPRTRLNAAPHEVLAPTDTVLTKYFARSTHTYDS